MIRKITVALLVLLSNGACRQDDAHGPCILSAISDDSSGDQVTFELQSRPNGQIVNQIQTAGQGIATYTDRFYNYANGIIVSASGGSGDDLPETWTYDGQLVTGITSSSDGSIAFSYDGSQLTSYTKTSGQNEVETGVFKYELGNVVSATISIRSPFSSTTSVSTSTYSGYDSKHNVFRLEADQLGHQVFIPSLDAPKASSISRNNYRSATIGPHSYQLTYSYNEAGYPTTITTKTVETLVESTQTFSYRGCH